VNRVVAAHARAMLKSRPRMPIDATPPLRVFATPLR
jgi:hypothetical protein